MTTPRQLPASWKIARQTLRGSIHAVRPTGGTWCILCHGFTGHRIGPGYLFVKCSRALEQIGISSLRFDFRGSGESDGLFREMTVDTMLADLASAVSFVRRNRKPKRLILLGHSLGGMVAALYAARREIDGMALIAPVGDPAGLIRRREAIMTAGPNAAGCYENGPHEISVPFIESLKNIDPPAMLARGFKGKLFLVQGDADASIPVAESARYVETTLAAGGTAACHILRGADHNFSTVSTMREAVRRLTAWAKEFLP